MLRFCSTSHIPKRNRKHQPKDRSPRSTLDLLLFLFLFLASLPLAFLLPRSNAAQEPKPELSDYGNALPTGASTHAKLTLCTATTSPPSQTSSSQAKHKKVESGKGSDCTPILGGGVCMAWHGMAWLAPDASAPLPQFPEREKEELALNRGRPRL
ncbi:hypothetical protein GW17_00023539 [Ensete ventricosum]|nr:hypothetical protein GW17_00023539 [Ensete ventricosum]